jgi:NAD(P)-dependent dehydrogenase (short-subunit alcohol dehydrogenase family)
MGETFASELLRPSLLEDVCILLAGAARPSDPPSAAAAVASACTSLGAQVSLCAATSERRGQEQEPMEEAPMDEAVERALSATGPIGVLVVDAAALFAACSEGAQTDEREGGRAALSGCLDGTWNVTRAVVRSGFLAPARGGRIIYIAPAVGAGEHADAARAGLENLARTLSVEWARYGITATVITPGNATTDDQIAQLVCFLVSPAGDYFSGCRFSLGVTASAG